MKRVLLAALLTSPAGLAAQLDARVADVEDGVVRFSYATRAGVEICHEGIRMGERQIQWHGRGWDRRADCRPGPAEVELRVRRGEVTGVDVVRQLDARSAEATDLGEVPAEEAARYLLSLASLGATARGAEEAVLPALIADVEEIWTDLLELARDRGLDGRVRKSLMFWLGQEAATAVTGPLADMARDEDEEQGVREAAIFALSQRPQAEGVPALMDVVRDVEDAETRRTALFWLAQSDDPRVLDFFEGILLGRIR